MLRVGTPGSHFLGSGPPLVLCTECSVYPPSLVDGADDALLAEEVLADLLDHPEVGLGGHLGAKVAVEGGGVAALLHVAQHVHPRRELALALLGEQAVEEVSAVVVVALLVPKDQAPLHPARVQLARQHLNRGGRNCLTVQH